ncbi:MAG: toll/interleukin-1 receptor domain-containing protein [Candidatus Binatia bacterium]
MAKPPPAAFLSHSSVDNEISTRLAKDLRANGVDVWYAEWEIKPGDSLRRKIDEGIERATHFLVLLTENSLRSEWVQTELDAGLIQRINGSCRLIPIIWKISSADVPPLLRGLLWVNLEPYDEGLRKLVNICHGVETRPPLGEPPGWTQAKVSQNLGLSTLAGNVALLLNERSKTGAPLDPMLTVSSVLDALQVNEEEIAAAADELEDLGWVKLHKLWEWGGARGFTESPQLHCCSSIPIHSHNLGIRPKMLVP